MEVIIYSSPDDKKKNRGFCFLEYESHKAASLAKRRLGTGRIKVWLYSQCFSMLQSLYFHQTNTQSRGFNLHKMFHKHNNFSGAQWTTFRYFYVYNNSTGVLIRLLAPFLKETTLIPPLLVFFRIFLSYREKSTSKLV